ncbi:hypothetical protein HDK90DRAFT_120602 [Phyllosticta capitalensis]|uniref:Uncharacterized protein n=1 Tax=Phyllosticta capitalensis TaxID=121624 RepID=A0ABR1YA14_9PEZI
MRCTCAVDGCLYGWWYISMTGGSVEPRPGGPKQNFEDAVPWMQVGANRPCMAHTVQSDARLIDSGARTDQHFLLVRRLFGLHSRGKLKGLHQLHIPASLPRSWNTVDIQFGGCAWDACFDTWSLSIWKCLRTMNASHTCGLDHCFQRTLSFKTPTYHLDKTRPRLPPLDSRPDSPSRSARSSFKPLAPASPRPTTPVRSPHHRAPTKKISQNETKRRNKTQNVQQPGFAAGHPRNY